MEKNKVVIRGSFRGISADFVRNILILLLTWVVYLLCNSYKESLFEKKQITSFITYLLSMENVAVVCIIAVIYLVMIIAAIIAISTIIKTVGVLYHLADVTTFDFTSNRVVSKSFSFPFNKVTDENKFNEVINVNIEQGVLHRLFNVGNIYIEFLTYNTVDTQLRNLEIQAVALPFMQKNKIM